MPLVHHLTGTAFEANEARSAKLRAGQTPTVPLPKRSAPDAAGSSTGCKLCDAQASVFDLSMRCCLDRYESVFGSVHEHRSMFALARAAALDGDFVPARRLVESYRRVFGTMAAVTLKRRLWQSISEAQIRPHLGVLGENPKEPGPAA